jgi:hypothetical protein
MFSFIFFLIEFNNIYDTRAYAKETIPSPAHFLKYGQFGLKEPGQRIPPDDIVLAHLRLFGNRTKSDSLPVLIQSESYLSSWNETTFARANEWYLQEPIRYSVPSCVPLDGKGLLALDLQEFYNGVSSTGHMLFD